MAESGLAKVGIFVTIVGTIIGTVIAVATFLNRDDGPSKGPTPPSVTGDGCGVTEPPVVTLSEGQAPRGGQVTVYGSCFQPDELVEIRVHATEVGSATADSKGDFTQIITIPQSAPPPGFPTDISATGKRSVKTGTAPFQTE